MAIFKKKTGGTKVGNLIRKVVSKVKEAAKTNLGASVIGAVTKASPAAVKKIATQTQPKTTALPPRNMSLASGGFVDDKGKVQKGTPSATPLVYAPQKSSGSSSSSKSTSSLSKATIPTSADQILSASRTGSFSLGSSPSNSSTTMGLGSTAGAISSVAGINEANDLALQQKKSAEQLALDQASQAQEKNQTFLEKIFQEQQQAPTREELRQDYEKEFNIKARTAEINSLQQSLDKVMNDVANQEAVAQDRLGTNDFINNQIAQIRRNAEPVINQLSSEIKWKSGLLNQDISLMNEAISDALADNRNRIENMKWLYNETSQYLDGKYKEALSSKIRQEDRQYEEMQATAEYARDVVLAYAKAGKSINIKPTDSIDEINAKIMQNPLPQGGGSVGGTNYSNLKLSGAQKSDLVDIDVLNSQISTLENLASDGILEGVGPLGAGTLKQLQFSVFGSGSNEGAVARTTIGNIKAQIAKLRGGTSFTANEEKLLNSYVPGINESTASILAKMAGLKTFLMAKQGALIRVGGGSAPTNSNDPLGIL